MGEHRRVVGRRRARPRVRYDRVVAATASLLITAVGVLAAVGVIPVGDPREPVPQGTLRTAAQETADTTAQEAATGGAAAGDTAPQVAPAPALPADSGSGKRVVFSIGEQRIWLVDSRERVRSTYLASGSLTDNLQPGSYAVYSRSRHAVGIDDSGEMEFFVRFTRGEHAAIGFHSIPSKDGEPLQTVAELGTPTSHGCIRQRRADAQRLWSFAPVGTTVVVTA